MNENWILFFKFNEKVYFFSSKLLKCFEIESLLSGVKLNKPNQGR